jgi:ADP-ribosyl-[dinitrogen reductase] hydrolase
MTEVTSEMVGGGVHDTAIGEWTDDGAMAVAIADAYISKGGFAPSEIAANFKMWKKTGHFGTRNYVFDIGRTCSTSIDAMTTDRPYMGSTDFYASGNGTIMRLAPIMLANHNDVGLAIAESVAVSLMTHGTHNIVQCTAGFVSECMAGTKFLNYNRIRNYNTRNGERTVNTIMHAYAQAWNSVDLSHSFEDAVVHAVNLGYDADTVGAVTGMLAGRKYGLKGIPTRWLDKLVKKDELIDMAEKLYALGGEDQCPSS